MGALRGVARVDLVRRLEERFQRLEAPILMRLTGPAGGGRTRLLEELYERLAAGQSDRYWPSLGTAERTPGVARDLREDQRLELAPARLEGLAGLLPPYLWLAVHGAAMPSPLRGSSLERVEILGSIDAQLEAHFGPLLRSIEARFGTADALRVGKFLLNFVPVLNSLTPLIDAGDLRGLARRLDPSLRERASRASIAAQDTVEVRRDPSGLEEAERIAKVIATLSGEKGLPALIVVDDAELADAATVEMLTQLLRSSSRVMIVATTRTEPRDGFDEESPFEMLVEDLRERRPARLREEMLPPIEREGLRAIVTDRFPGAVGGGVAQVLDVAGDNPLVLSAILVSSGVQRALLEGDAIPERLLATLPRSVEGVFGTIWEALHHEVKDAFSLAALQGDPFDARWVRALPSPIPDGLDRGHEEGLVEFEQFGSELLGRFRRSWVQLRARDALRTEADDRLLTVAIPAYLGHVEERLRDPQLKHLEPKLLRALLGAYVALGVGDALIPGRHATAALDRAALLLARAEDRLGRIDVALDVLRRARTVGPMGADELAADWAVVEAQLLRRLGRPSESLAVLDRLGEAPAEHALPVLLERIRASDDAYVPIDVRRAILDISAALEPSEGPAAPVDSSLRGEACRVLASLFTASSGSELALLETLVASQEPHLDRVEVLRLRSKLAGANAKAGRFDRARELWLEIEQEVSNLEPWVARLPDFRGDYASWLPVVGEFWLGVELMRQAWEERAEFLSASYPTVLTGRQNLIYWLVEGGEMEPAAAVEEYAKIAATMATTMDPEHPVLRNVRTNHALMLMKDGAFAAAQAAVDALRADPVDDDAARRGRNRIDLLEAEIRAGLGDMTGALELSRRGHGSLRDRYGPTSWLAFGGLTVRARFEEPEVALALIDEALSEAEPLARALNSSHIGLLAERARIQRDLDGLGLVLARQVELLGAAHEDAVRTRSYLASLGGATG